MPDFLDECFRQHFLSIASCYHLGIIQWVFLFVSFWIIRHFHHNVSTGFRFGLFTALRQDALSSLHHIFI